MPLAAQLIASLVYTDHLSIFPDAVDATRANPVTGVPLHVISEEFIKGLCTGLVNGVLAVTLKDLGSGDDDTPGTSGPETFTLPGIALAAVNFKIAQGWDGESSEDVLDLFIKAPLQFIEANALILMTDNANLGTGTGIISPASNPTLQAEAKETILTELRLAFEASGKFAKDDIPGNPVNEQLLVQLSAYADAYAEALASALATVDYTGGGGGSSVSGIVNTGSFV